MGKVIFCSVACLLISFLFFDACPFAPLVGVGIGMLNGGMIAYLDGEFNSQ